MPHEPLEEDGTPLQHAVVRMRERPRPWDYCYWPAAANLAVLRAVAEELRRRPGAVVLDLGCGRQPFRRLFEGARYVGLDRTPAARADLVGDLTAPLGVATGSVDCVLLSEVLEHLRDPGAVVAEACRVLRPGGVLFVSTPFAFPVHARPHDYLRFTEYWFAALEREHPLRVERVEATNLGITTPLLLLNQLLLYGRALPAPLKGLLWLGANLAAWPAERLLGRFRRVGTGGAAGRFLTAVPLGYAVVLRRTA